MPKTYGDIQGEDAAHEYNAELIGTGIKVNHSGGAWPYKFDLVIERIPAKELDRAIRSALVATNRYFRQDRPRARIPRG